MGQAVSPPRRKWIPSEGELASTARMTRHLAASLKALLILFALSAIIIANGNYLVAHVGVDQNSILFWLWPFNKLYLQQFSVSSYQPSELKWFFTAVSFANLALIVFFLWKLFFEITRKDVEFPKGKSPNLTRFILRFFVISVILLLLELRVAARGFDLQDDTLFSPSIKQSIGVGAFKIVMGIMFFLYVGAAFVIEFGGLGLRYLLAKLFGWFTVKDERNPDGPRSDLP